MKAKLEIGFRHFNRNYIIRCIGVYWTMGKTDVGEGIGYYGGFALGYTGGLGYARQNMPSLAQSLMYTSSVSWGLIQGEFCCQSL